MKTLLLVSVVSVLGTVCVSCGSNWTIEGNQINVTRCVVDTVVPAGTVILNVE